MRPKSKAILNEYVDISGSSYKSLGLEKLNSDFRACTHLENLLRNRNKTDLIVARRRHSFGYDSFSRRDLDFIVIPRYDFQMSTRPSDSMYAAWTIDELKLVVPEGSKRRWLQIVPFGFVSFQIIVGLPEGRQDLFLKKSPPVEVLKFLIPDEFKID